MKKEENKKHIKRIIIKIINICSYAIAITSIFILILVSIFSCSGVDKNIEEYVSGVNSLVQETNLRVKNKNNLGSFGVNDTLGYGLDSGDMLIQPSKIVLSSNYYTDYYVSLGSNMAVVVRDNVNSTITLDETWHIYFHLSNPVVTGDYIRIETDNWTRVYTVSLQNGEDTFYVSSLIAPENYVYNDIYCPYSLGYSAENYNKFLNDLNRFFIQLPYVDYRFSSNWSPWAYLEDSQDYYFTTDGVTGATYEPLHYLNGKFVNNAIFGNSLKILDNTVFSINGFLYTDLLIHCQVLTAPKFHIYYDNYNDFKEYIAPLAIDSYFVDFVYAYNHTSERYQVIYKIPYDDENNIYSVYAFNAGFTNEAFKTIRLFDFNLNTVTLSNFTNGTALTVDSYVLFNGGGIVNSESMLDGLTQVFNLINFAFRGIADLLNIQVGSGITLLGLALIPFVAGIILTVIWLFKR